MNRLIIDKDVNLVKENKINLKEELVGTIKSIKIKVLEDCDLVIETDAEDIKLSITVNIVKGVKLNIYELKKGNKYKIRYLYYLEKDSSLNIEKINDINQINEEVIFNLNGENALVNYNLKTISQDKEKYNLLVYHNAKKTKSNIINNGVNILKGVLEFNVSSFIPEKKVKCEASQFGRIINETSNECVVKPNLFIDEEDVIANHSALIGTFSNDELFYLMSRGIKEDEAKILLTKGFLLKNITYHREYLEKMISSYWR